jgi:hypothetical protein
MLSSTGSVEGTGGRIGIGACTGACGRTGSDRYWFGNAARAVLVGGAGTGGATADATAGATFVGSYIVWLSPTLPAEGTTVGFSTMLGVGAATVGGTDFSKA